MELVKQRNNFDTGYFDAALEAVDEVVNGPGSVLRDPDELATAHLPDFKASQASKRRDPDFVAVSRDAWSAFVERFLERLCRKVFGIRTKPRQSVPQSLSECHSSRRCALR